MSRPPRRTRSLAHLASTALVAFAAFAAAAVDPRPARPPAYRAGYRVLEADLHGHTTWSDGSLTPAGFVMQAERRGLDVVAVTEHNTVVPSRIARAFSTLAGGPVVLTGQEVTTARFHIVALGIERTVNPVQPASAVVADIHQQGGIAIAAHPVALYWPALVPIRGELDGAEVMHPLAFREGRPGFRWSEAVEFFERADEPLAAIGSSDYHWMSVLGICRTLVFVTEPVTERAVLDAIRAKRTVVVDQKGSLRGPRELTQALERDPYTPRTSDYAYRGEGALDRVARVVGLFGLAGLAFLRTRRRHDE